MHSLPSFVESGEFATASSAADIVQVECDPVFAHQTVTLTADELNSRCIGGISWSTPFPYSPVPGPSYTVLLDDDGNATAAIWAGPLCAAGTSLISAHLNTAPFTTATTTFTLLPPQDTPPGVYALPSSEVEDSTTSSVATVIYVEFPSVFAEQLVRIRSGELFSRCLFVPKLLWVGADRFVTAAGDNATVQLDNNGNAFVFALGGVSCAPGTSLIEASQLSPPYTTYTTYFTILSPRVT